MISNNIRIPACDGLERFLCRYVVEFVQFVLKLLEA